MEKGFIRIYDDKTDARCCLHVYQARNGHIYRIERVWDNLVIAGASRDRERNFNHLLSLCDFNRRLSSYRYTEQEAT